MIMAIGLLGSYQRPAVQRVYLQRAEYITCAMRRVSWQPRQTGLLAAISPGRRPSMRAALSALTSASSGPLTAISFPYSAFSHGCRKRFSLVATMIRPSPEGVYARRTDVEV